MFFSELLEHVDKTDKLMHNCSRHLIDNGYLLCSVPNLASIWGRLELLFGLQPHTQEISDENPQCGMGLPGKLNNPANKRLHHIRSMTYKAIKEFLGYHGFTVIKTVGYTGGGFNFAKHLPSIAGDVLYICRKKR